MLRATPDEVYREARACIESARPKANAEPAGADPAGVDPALGDPAPAPFVLSTGCEIPFKAPVETVRALARAAAAGL